MSVINQMLNQLEQRGAHTATDLTMVRAVPQSRRNFAMLLSVFVALIVGIVLWQWTQTRKPNAAPVVPEVAMPASGVVAADSPALQMSVELGSLPLPSSLRKTKNSHAQSAVEGAVQSANAQSVPSDSSDTQAAAQASGSALPMKQVSAVQQADAEFRKAAALMQQGRIADALAGYEAALRLDAGHDAARQALAALLQENKRGADAERVLQDGLNNKPEHTGFAMSLARLQVERGAVDQAAATLEKSLPFAATQAEYHAFFAALLQRQNRNEEAITHYQIALQIVPANGAWLMGYGISLQALQRNADAKEAFKHALDTKTLSPELQAFVQQKLKGL